MSAMMDSGVVNFLDDPNMTYVEEEKDKDDELDDVNLHDLSANGSMPSLSEYKRQSKQRRRYTAPWWGRNNHVSQKPDPVHRVVRISMIVMLVAVVVALSATVARHNELSGSDRKQRPDSTLDDLIVQVLGEGWTDRAMFDNHESPQYQAVKWMAVEDKSGQLDTDAFRERYAATVFYFALGGAEWHRGQAGFLKADSDVCEWFASAMDEKDQPVQIGLDCSCDHVSDQDQKLCDASQRSVKRIALPTMNLRGRIPEEIRQFEDLIELDLNHNLIEGSFPRPLMELAHLKRLVLAHNAFEGPLPEDIDQMGVVRYLDISENSFDGNVPYEIRNLIYLEVFNANNNHLQGDIQVFRVMGNLRALIMANNNITGHVDHTLMKQLPRLEVLDMSENQLHGNIPSGVIGHPNLCVLDLHGNQIDGDFPEIDPMETKLRYLSLRDNKITGSLAPTLLSAASSIYHLDVSKNLLTGTMPALIAKLSALEYLDLSFNKWDTGDIPLSYGQLTNLKYLAMQGTNREDFLRAELLENLSNLEILDVGHNTLLGLLPESLGMKTPKLKKLVLYHNFLWGNLEALDRATQLEELYINNNAWEDGAQLNEFCDVSMFPALDTVVAKNCTSDSQSGSNQPFCSCCHCCSAAHSTECGIDSEVHWFAGYDNVWETKFVRDQFRGREMIV